MRANLAVPLLPGPSLCAMIWAVSAGWIAVRGLLAHCDKSRSREEPETGHRAFVDILERAP